MSVPGLIRKNWNFDLLRSETLHRILEDLLTPLGCSALVMNGGQALHVRPGQPVDLATLPHAAALCAQYLHLKDGDGAILNDPLSSGTTLGDFTLVMGIDLEGAGADLLLARRVSFPQRLSAQDKLDEQGVRVPPTPLAHKGQLNVDLLRAISAHPFAPPGLTELIEAAWLEMGRVAKELVQLARDPGSEFKRLHFQRYLSDSSSAFQNLMTRLPLGHAIASMQLPTGEAIKLQMDVSETNLHFDFAGSDNSENLALTELETFGACVAATMNLIGQSVPMNAGTFEHFRVSAPSKTMVATRGLAGLFSGVTTGTASVAALVQNALAQLNPALKQVGQAAIDAHFELRFANSSYRGRVAPGAAANKDEAGLDAFALWSAPLAAQPLSPVHHSLEKIERAVPVTMEQVGVASGTGGKGRLRGGAGRLLHLKVKEPAELIWNFGRSNLAHEGLEGGKAGSAAKIEITRAGQTEAESHKGAMGQTQLRAGDQVCFYGAGGGGFGNAKESLKT